MKPVSKTAIYCTGVRALDARKPNPAYRDLIRATSPFGHNPGVG